MTIEERIKRAEEQLADLRDAQLISDEPWDFTQPINETTDYLDGLYAAKTRSLS